MPDFFLAPHENEAFSTILAALGRGLSFYVVSYGGGHRSAPCVIAALAGFVHDRESAANHEPDDDNDSYYGSVHCNLPCEPPISATRAYASGFNWRHVAQQVVALECVQYFDGCLELSLVPDPDKRE